MDKFGLQSNDTEHDDDGEEGMVPGTEGGTGKSNAKKVVLKQGSMYRIVDEQNSIQLNELPPAVYTLKNHPMMGLYLEELEPFELPTKLYSNADAVASRICAGFMKRPGRTTGVLLSGEKGSGKSMTSKLVCCKMLEQGVPTILISQPFAGDAFNQFLQSVPGSAVVFFDEFEKVYDYKSQEQLLTLFDGAYPMHKLMLLTVNDAFKVGNCFHNRPGRIYYSLEYGSLAPAFIEEYCKDNLVNKDHIQGVLTVAKMFRKFNFDMMQAMVNEMNLFNESAEVAIRMLNVRPTRDYYGDEGGRESEYFKAVLTIDGKSVRLQRDNLSVDPTNTVFTLMPLELAVYNQMLRYREYTGDDDEGTGKRKAKPKISQTLQLLLDVSEEATDECDDVQQGIKFTPNDALDINSLDGHVTYRRVIQDHEFICQLKSMARNKDFDFERHVTAGYGRSRYQSD